MERLSLHADGMGGISFLHQMSVSETYHIHTHDFYEIFYVMQGRAVHHINGASECCMSGTLELIRPEDVHEYSFLNRYDMEMVSIGIQRKVMAEILDFAGVNEEEIVGRDMPLSVSIDARNAEHIRTSLMKMDALTDVGRRIFFGKALIAELLFYLTEDEQKAAHIPQWLDALILQMDESDNYIAGLSRMLELSHVTQSHLNREVKKYLGMTPTEFINSKRIALAGDMLLQGDDNIINIAEKCGFETLSHFYDNFHRIYGCAPKEFVNNHKSK